MTQEKLATLIGELVSTEIDEVNRVEYVKDKELTAFAVVMENGKQFIVEVKVK